MCASFTSFSIQKHVFFITLCFKSEREDVDDLVDNVCSCKLSLYLCIEHVVGNFTWLKKRQKANAFRIKFELKYGKRKCLDCKSSKELQKEASNWADQVVSAVKPSTVN